MVTVRILLVLLVSSLFAPNLNAAVVQDPAAGSDDSEELVKKRISFDELPWQARLGVRSAQLSERISVVDQVVLVPDLATWLDEIGRWEQGVQWPVLIEDDRFTPLFVRRFQPARLLRRPSVGVPLPTDVDELAARVRSTAVRSWGGEPGKDDLDSIYRSINWWTPPGIVGTSFKDPAWPAALALAVGRGQLLRTIDGDFGPINGTLDAPGLATLENRISRLCAESGYEWKGLGDDIDAFTICRSLPVRTNAPLDKELRPKVPAAPQVGAEDPIAVTDLLCRTADGTRWALPGWIFGSNERSIYMAMCSLFIDRDSVLLMSAYGDSGNWKNYSIAPAADLLGQAGFEVVGVHQGMEATTNAWRRLMMNGPRADVFFLNSSGSPARLNLAEATSGSTGDVPSLNRPLALHMIHSYSLFAPDALTTIGAKWLDRGVYAYVGSCDEPYLVAFVPPTVVASRITNFSPFLAASRQDAGPMSLPWRVVTIGDPMMLIEPPERRLRKRIRMATPTVEGMIDVRRVTLAALKSGMDDADGVIDASTFADLHLLGQDELASKLWTKMMENEDRTDLTPARARALLPVFFSMRQASNYLAAYRIAGEPTGDPLEMLWTLWSPRLGALDSPLDLAMFQRGLRPMQAADDLALILPAIKRVGGRAERRAAIARAMESASNDYDRERLKAMLD